MAPASKFEKRGMDWEDRTDRDQFLYDFMGAAIFKRGIDDQFDSVVTALWSDLEYLCKLHCIEGAGGEDNGSARG